MGPEPTPVAVTWITAPCTFNPSPWTGVYNSMALLWPTRMRDTRTPAPLDLTMLRPNSIGKSRVAQPTTMASSRHLVIPVSTGTLVEPITDTDLCKERQYQATDFQPAPGPGYSYGYTPLYNDAPVNDQQSTSKHGHHSFFGNAEVSPTGVMVHRELVSVVLVLRWTFKAFGSNANYCCKQSRINNTNLSSKPFTFFSLFSFSNCRSVPNSRPSPYISFCASYNNSIPSSRVNSLVLDFSICTPCMTSFLKRRIYQVIFFHVSM